MTTKSFDKLYVEQTTGELRLSGETPPRLLLEGVQVGTDFDLEALVGALSIDKNAANFRVIPTESGLHALIARVASSSSSLTNNNAIDAISDNEFDTCLAVRGMPRSRGVIKVSHLKPTSGNTADDAAAISIDIQGDTSNAQGIFMRRTGTNLGGAFIVLRNDSNSYDILHVHTDERIGIGTPAATQPLGRLQVRQRVTSEKLVVLTGIASATGALVEITSDAGTAQILPDLTFVGPKAPSGIPGHQNLIGWTYDPALATTSTTLANAGAVFLNKIYAAQTGTVSKIAYFLSGSAPTVLSNTFVGLYDSSGALLAQSADLSADWMGATGKKLTSLTAGVSVTGGQPYYAAFLYGAATTHPTLIRGTSGSVVNIGLAAGTFRYMRSGAGLTALPSSITLASATETADSFWFGVSA